MSALPHHWLAGRRVIAAGEFAHAVAAALRMAGAATYEVAATNDVTEIAAAFDASETALGGAIDILVHGGDPEPLSLPDGLIDAGRWRSGLASELDGRFFFASEFARRAIGSVCSASVVMIVTPGSDPLVATASGAMDTLVKTLAVEWARDGIRVNAIVAHDPAAAALGATTAYLASDYAAYITGTRITIHGNSTI